MHKFIINADDFGKNRDINQAIISAMNSNLCMDTTLLVNFEESSNAAKLAIENNKKNDVGIHLNLTEGYPLTNNIKNEKRFCNNKGFFHNKKHKRIILLSTSEKRAVYEELTSQIHLCRKYGIPISHADSHNHIHEEPGLFLIFLNILKRENIPFLRIAKNVGKNSYLNKLYRNIYNTLLSSSKITGTNYFGSISDYYISKNKIQEKSIIEIMIHPGIICNDHIIDIYSKENLSIRLPEIIDGNTLISYYKLHK